MSRATAGTIASQPGPSPFDFRVWMHKVKAIGQLQQLDGVDLKFELSAVAELNAQQRGPAILFRKFAGYPNDFGVLTGSMLNAKTLGLTLGIDETLRTMELTDRVATLLATAEARAKDYAPQVVSEGPVMQNRQVGDEVDLGIFPAPLWHELDGGVYIGTGSVVIERDPDTGWVNVGAYRVQRQSKNTLGNYISPGHHGSIIRQKYWNRGDPCPVVMVFGAHPLFVLIGGVEIPAGADEYNWIGAIAGQRVPVIRGPITGLPIPADAEIAVEGFVTKGDLQLEGPFGEATGYYGGGNPEPLVRVKAVYYRNNPIVLGFAPARPPHDFTFFSSVMRSAAIKESLRKAGVPGVKGVWVSEAGVGRMWVVTSIEQQYAGHAAQAAHIAVQCQAGGSMNRYSIVVDDDIDPSNNNDVIWALTMCSDPATDIDVVRQGWSNGLDPLISPEDKEKKNFCNSRAIINACRPWHRLKANNFPRVAEATPALRKATKLKFASLFQRSD